MDRVRLGRALGYGARHAAKTLLQAADAATAPTANSSPSAARPSPAPSREPIRAAPPAKQQASKSFLHPVKRYSGVVLLQVVGTFFAMFALLMAENAWRLRAGIHASLKNSDAQHLCLMVALSLLFAWFAISSFVRARRTGRG